MTTLQERNEAARKETVEAVEKLVAKFGVPEVGVIVGHDAIAEVIGKHRRTSRYCSIVAAWRAWLWQHHNLDMRCRVNLGYEVLTAKQRLEASVHDLDIGVKRTKKADVRARAAPAAELDEVGKRAQGHLLEVTTKLCASADEALKKARQAFDMPPVPRSFATTIDER